MVNSVADELANLLKVLLVGGIEGVQVLAVNVEHGHYVPHLIIYRHHNLAPRLAAARNVTCKLLYIGYGQRAALSPCRAADPTPVGNMVAGHWALEGSQQQFVVDNTVEPRPPKMERVMDERSRIGHHARLVAFSLNEAAQLEQQLAVLFLLVHGLIEAVALDAAYVQDDARHDAKQSRKQQCVVGGELADAGGDQYQSARDYQYQANAMGDFLHKNVKFQAKLRNNWQLAVADYQFFRTFAAAKRKNNIYLIN